MGHHSVATQISPEPSRSSMTESMLLNLPPELRLNIYRQYFDCWTATIYYDTLHGRFKLSGCPGCSLLLVNRQIHAESRRVREHAFDGRLVLRDAKVCTKPGVGFQSSLEVVATLGIDRLLSQIRVITIQGGAPGMLMLLPWYKFRWLQKVELEDHYRCNPFAVGRVSRTWPFETTEDDEGICRVCGVHGWSKWTQAPDCVSDGRVRVFTVKRGFFSGACLKAVAEHKADYGVFVDRVCEDVNGGWNWIVNQAGSL